MSKSVEWSFYREAEEVNISTTAWLDWSGTADDKASLLVRLCSTFIYKPLGNNTNIIRE